MSKKAEFDVITGGLVIAEKNGVRYHLQLPNTGDCEHLTAHGDEIPAHILSDLINDIYSYYDSKEQAALSFASGFLDINYESLIVGYNVQNDSTNSGLIYIVFNDNDEPEYKVLCMSTHSQHYGVLMLNVIENFDHLTAESRAALEQKIIDLSN